MKSRTKQKASDLLRAARLRRTGPRVAILSALLGAGRPLTQDRIAARLGSAAPNKVTIYRVLESLLGVGLVHKAFLQERTWHFEAAGRCTESQCHPHFTCTNCGNTHCLTEVSLPMAKNPPGFVIGHQRVQLEGLCPDCSERKPT